MNETSERYQELKFRAEIVNKDVEKVYEEILEAYHKGQISCNEYMSLYDMILAPEKKYKKTFEDAV